MKDKFGTPLVQGDRVFTINWLFGTVISENADNWGRFEVRQENGVTATLNAEQIEKKSAHAPNYPRPNFGIRY
jgi:preprotein translocase subunit YajC